MICPNGHDAADSVSFCPECGVRMSAETPTHKICANGHVVHLANQFCPYCGDVNFTGTVLSEMPTVTSPRWINLTLLVVGAITAMSTCLTWAQVRGGVDFSRTSFQLGDHNSFNPDAVLFVASGAFAALLGLLRLVGLRLRPFFRIATLAVLVLADLDAGVEFFSVTHWARNVNSTPAIQLLNEHASIGPGLYIYSLCALVVTVVMIMVVAREQHVL